MKHSFAATLLAQCVPTLSHTMIVDRASAVKKTGLTSSTRLLLHESKNQADRLVQKRWLSNVPGVLKNSLFQSLKSHRHCDPTSTDPDIGILSCGEGLSCRPNHASDVGGLCQPNLARHGTSGIIRARRVDSGFFIPTYSSGGEEKTTDKQSECDPNSPDLGILSCQVGHICVHDASSELGGICIQRAGASRRLYTVDDILQACDPSSYYHMKYCDCTGVNNSTGSGSIDCFQQDVPFGSYFPGCEAVMADSSLTYSFSSRSLISRTWCYEFAMSYYQKICVTGFYPTGAYSADSCSITFNGQECSSCAVTDELYDFDCSTIDARVVGSTLYDLFPAIAQCATGTVLNSTTTCTLCSQGDFIPETKYGINVTVGEYGTISCGEMAYAASNKLIPDANCSSFVEVAQIECCEPSHTQGTTNAPTPGSSDPIVPDGGESETKPDEERSLALPVVSVSGVVWSVITATLAQILGFW